MTDMNVDEGDVELQRYVDILIRRRWIVLAVAVVSVLSVALMVYTQIPLYQAKALLLIEKAREGGARLSQGAVVENTQDDYYQTQYKLLRTDSLLGKVYEALNLKRHPDFDGPHGVQALKSMIKISPVRRSRLVHVEVESADPALASRVANSVAKAYVKQNLENQLFISKEILQAMSVSPDSAEGRRLQEGLPAVVNNRLIQQLKADYVKLQAQAAHMSNRYTEKHPERRAVEANMRSLAAQIRIETNRIVQALKTELSGQLKGNNVRVVDLARVPTAPYKPRKARAISMALAAGLLLGFLLALLVEFLDQTIRTQEDVEKRLLQPFLGLVPFLQMPSEALPYESLTGKGLSLSGEAFRNLRTMLDFANVSADDRNFLVSSTVQEEGKSYVATNVSVAFAQMGEKVLLIDGDLRRPKLHKNFQLSGKVGLSDFLAMGKGVDELGDLVQKSKIPGLDVLACGTRPPNPSELLNTPRLSALLAWVKQRYNRIIVDCTPMFPIHDTLLWGRHIRSAAFVVRYGKTRVPLIKDAVQRLKGAGVKVVGVAINAAKPGGLTYAGYGYYYQHYYKAYQATPARRA